MNDPIYGRAHNFKPDYYEIINESHIYRWFQKVIWFHVSFFCYQIMVHLIRSEIYFKSWSVYPCVIEKLTVLLKSIVNDATYGWAHNFKPDYYGIINESIR